MITKAFNIEMPNKPYVDNFSDNTVHASEYVGFKYVKVIVDAVSYTHLTLPTKA